MMQTGLILSIIYSKLPFIFTLIILNLSNLTAVEPVVKIHYLGHSAFVLEFDNGVKIVTDYGHNNAWKEWGWDSQINDIGNIIPDVMTFSHLHDDHFDSTRIPNGVRFILKGTNSLKIKGIKIIPIPTCENDISIKNNTSFLFIYKNIRICHLGDAQAQIMNINNEIVKNKITALFSDPIDILLMPIEGKQKFIPQAEKFIAILKPQKLIPTHYWSTEYLVTFIDHILKQNINEKKYEINKINSSKYLYSKSIAKSTTEIITLERSQY